MQSSAKWILVLVCLFKNVKLREKNGDRIGEERRRERESRSGFDRTHCMHVWNSQAIHFLKNKYNNGCAWGGYILDKLILLWNGLRKGGK